MSKLLTNPSASDFKVGDQVRWSISEKHTSSYVGVVTHVCPKTNKVWVEFPTGNRQVDPTELVLVPSFVGKSPVTQSSGYDSYEKYKSEKINGQISKILKKAESKIDLKKGDYIRLKPNAEIYLSYPTNKRPPKWAIEGEIWVIDDMEEDEDGGANLNVSILGILGKENPGAFCSWVHSNDVKEVVPKPSASPKNEKVKKMASKIAYTFADQIVSKIANDIVDCINNGKNDIQTYQIIYPKYAKICSDGFIKFAISKIYYNKG